jgi:hypothetical protein
MSSTSPHVFTVGEVLTAANTNTYLGATAAVYKTSNTTITSSTTLTSDPDLVLALAANVNYAWQFIIFYAGGTQGSSDIKYQWTLPAGASLSHAPVYISTAGAAGVGATYPASTPRPAGTNGGGNTLAITASGEITTGGTAGNLTLQWAQNTSSGTGTTVQAGSWAAIYQYS